MRIQSVLLLLTVFLAGCASPKEFVRQGTDFGKYRHIAVLPFADYAEHPGSGAQVADITSISLRKSPFQVMESSRTVQLLIENKLEIGGNVKGEAAAAIGKALGVQALLEGSIGEYGTSSTHATVGQSAREMSIAEVTLSLIDCDTGEAVWSSSTRRTVDGAKLEAVAAAKAVDALLKVLYKRLE